MKKYIRSIRPGVAVITFCLLFGMNAILSAQTVQSDYEIQKSFKEQVLEMNKAIEQAASLAEVDSLWMQIDSLKHHFADHQTLINKVIYPKTFDEQIGALQRQARSTGQYLTRIHQQEQQLGNMNSQLATYSTRLNRLTDRTDSLKTAVQRTEQSRAQLAAEIENYKNQLRERDELILSFIDSVIINYQKLGANSLSDIEETGSERRLNVSDNPLELTRSITRESTELLTSNTTFTTEDYLRMKAVNEELKRMWTIVGEDLSSIYSPDPAQAQQEVLRGIHEWEETLDNRMWASLQQSFQQTGIELSEFNSDTTFFNALNSYVNQAAAESREDNGTEAQQKYHTFSEFWNNTVKQKWTDHLNKAELMTSAQIVQIDEKVNQWASLTEQESNMLAYLLGGSLLVLAVLGFMLFQEKRNGATKQTSPNA